MLEEGKVYLVKTTRGSVWLFKKYSECFRNKMTSCYRSICLDDMYKTNTVGYICDNSNIVYIKEASDNYISIWNREFNDNVELR